MGRSTISVQQWEALAEAARYRVHELARLRNVTTRHLRRQFLQYFGCSPNDWLTEQRIRAAERRLLGGGLIKTIAFELGFKQPSHFCRLFKSLKGMTPSEFVTMNGRGHGECPIEITDVPRR